MSKFYHVYIMASGRNGTLYTGITSDIAARAWQHRTGAVAGFTKRHRINRLVYLEAFADVNEAILREKRIKNWRRAWRLELIERDNPQWLDLFERINA